jgi:hypothetical protein
VVCIIPCFQEYPKGYLKHFSNTPVKFKYLPNIAKLLSPTLIIIWHCILGFGFACGFIASSEILRHHFQKRIYLASALVTAGEFCGTCVLPLPVQAIFQHYDFNVALGIISTFHIVHLVTAIVYIETSVEQVNSSKMETGNDTESTGLKPDEALDKHIPQLPVLDKPELSESNLEPNNMFKLSPKNQQSTSKHMAHWPLGDRNTSQEQQQTLDAEQQTQQEQEKEVPKAKHTLQGELHISQVEHHELEQEVPALMSTIERDSEHLDNVHAHREVIKSQCKTIPCKNTNEDNSVLQHHNTLKRNESLGQQSLRLLKTTKV